MNLKDFLNTRDKPPELYWSLVIEPGWVQAGIWYIGATSAEVLNVSPPTAWQTKEELVSACDAALSSSVQKLPQDYSEPSKTVFGVPASWVKGGEIQEEYLSDVKVLCTELSLTPVGFVVLPEAIAHLYKSEEGSPLNAVIVGLGREALEVTVFKLGNLVGNTTVARSVSLIEDVTEGLSRFEGASPLPSRIIVFDGKGGELEEAKETLMNATWSEGEKDVTARSVKFLHTPKVEIFSSDRKVVAVSLAGANEIGHVSKVTEKTEVLEDVVANKEWETPENQENSEIGNVTTPAENITPETLGFVVGEDISVRNQTPVNPVQQQNFEPLQSVSYLQKTKNLFHNFSRKISGKPHFPTGPKNNKLIIVISILIATFLIGGGAFWWFYPTATITVFVSPKKFSQETNISFSVSGKSDLSIGIIPGKILTSKVSGNKTKATTGTRLVGDKAKGSVTISNGNPSAITLSAGTFLTSSSGLKFVTNSEASVSGQLLPGSPGTANVEVTAGDIGAQYNLAKGEIFSVGNFSKSLVAATSQGDFPGGNSQEISAVSKDDQINLEKDLKNELLQQAQTELSGKITTDQVFVNEAAKVDITSENFDHKIGDPADNLKLGLALTVTGMAGDNAKLLEYAKVVLNGKTPGGYTLKDDQINYKFTFVKATDDLYNYNVLISANFLPIENTEAIKEKIKGRTSQRAEEYLNTIPGFIRAGVTLSPPLPGFLGTLPQIAGNITIDVVAEQ